MNSKEQLIQLRKETGMNRKQFCEYFDIPYRKVTDWELGNRQMPEYLLRLMKYKVEVERLMMEVLAGGWCDASPWLNLSYFIGSFLGCLALGFLFSIPKSKA